MRAEKISVDVYHNGVYINTYESMALASKRSGIPVTTISRKVKSGGGEVKGWRFEPNAANGIGT